MKRKRNIILDIEEESTFINNSDYDDKEPNNLDGVHNEGHSNASDDSEDYESDEKMDDEVEKETRSSELEQEVAHYRTKDESITKQLEDTTKQSFNGADPEGENGHSFHSEEAIKMEKKQSDTEVQQSFSETEIKVSTPQKATEQASRPNSKDSKNENEPRLVINKLILTNFKSYAGEQIIGPFHSSFSSVVGPNGSGKSNVIDAMLFVFGFKANKMRQGKVSELIHNSGNERPDFCQVDIHFHMVLDDPKLPQSSVVVPNSELVISRKAFQNNQSMYYIDGKKSNYTDVTALLRGRGIDLDHKRFLILQGEVESIAQMKAKAEKEGEDGLLEYLEDIIGTTKYKQLIEDSMTRIEELNTVCQEKSDRFELVEKDKNLLDEKKVEALKFLELERKLNNFKSLKFQSNISHLQSKIEEYQKEADELEKQLDEKKNANEAVLRHIEAETSKQQELKKELKKVLHEIEGLNKQKRDLNKQNVSFEEKSKNFESKLKRIQKTINTSTHSLQSSNHSLSSYSNSSEQYKADIERLDSTLKDEEEKLTRIREKMAEKTSGFTKRIEELQNKLEPWTSKLKDNENEIELITSNINILESQMNNTKKQLEENKEKLSSIKHEGKQKEEECREKEEKLETIEEQTSLGEEQTNLMKLKLDKMKSHITRAKNKYHDSAQAFQSKQNQSSVLAALTKLGKSGRIEGFYGKLGDLGTIDEKYDIAVSTAAPGLDSMVVETVETAQVCIDYLRKNKLGYANFICLNKLRNYDLSPIAIPGDPSKIKRLFDLIDPINPKFAPAFFSKMFNTLVAPDLNEAKKVAYGARRWKCVTLDGKVIDIAGTMSGGGNQIMKNAMRLKSANSSDNIDFDEESLENTRLEIEEMEAEFEREQKKYNEAISALNKVRSLEPETRLSLDKLRLDITGLASEMKEVTQVCKNLVAEQRQIEANNPFERQILGKKAELEKLEAVKVKLKSEMADYENEIATYEQKIMEAGGVDLKVQNSKVESIKQQIAIINDKTSGDRIALKKLESDIKRHTKVIEDSKITKENLEADHQQIKEAQQEVQEKVRDLEEKIHALDQTKQDKEEQLEVIRVEIEEKQEELSGFKSFEVEILNKLEKVTHSLKKITHSIEQNESSLDALVVRDVLPYIYWLDEDEQKKYNSSVIERLSESELEDVDLDGVNSEIEELEKYMSTVQIDIEMLKEYGTKIAEYTERKNDLNSAVEERDEKRDYCEDLKKKRLDEFMDGFSAISMALKDMYRMITMGGNAELELVDSLDPFSEGILFSVMPPKKSWKNISNLSGGEKTLSSLALVFALHSYKPTPLYVMDEIDAALDFRNVSIVANYIKERTKNAQFVVISLRNNMFELAQKLIGIYKVNNMTRSTPILNIEFNSIE
ncbi:SMC4 [Candida margitis]|uniref:SMC4 n=1 Tax=Candida margitis TaxID=1775924 RepID=UPI002225D61F|nr:SMC4 [Candida margitis]KAI5968018.1 SMC4 [Candida margitis]